jgi:hypothetical protein
MAIASALNVEVASLIAKDPGGDLQSPGASGRAHTPPPPWRRITKPRLGTTFVGRIAELASLTAALVDDQRKRFVIVSGLPGIGKSSLISQFCAHPMLENWFPGGVYELDLREVDAENLAEAAYSGTSPGGADSN